MTSNFRLHLPRRSLLLAGILLVCSLAASLFAAQAHALVVEVGGTRVGIQDREVSQYWEGTRKWRGLGSDTSEANAPATSFNNPAGNLVVHSANTYAIYWDPQGGFYHGDWQGLINGFLANAGSSGGQLASVFALDSQYSDGTNQPAATRSVFHGGATDTNPYPASGCTDPRPFEFGAPLTDVCLSDTDVRAELQTYIQQHNLPRGMGTIYYMFTPPGVAVCLDAGGPTGHCSDFAGTIAEVETAEAKSEEPTSRKSYKKSFCSYHGAIGSGDANTVLYAAIPWSAGGLADNQLGTHDKDPAYECQDGGFEPSKQPNGELQEVEEVRRPQEPNQAPGRSPDGGFDTGLADLIINQVAEEQQNIVTDPLLNAWQDSAGSEVTDECRNLFQPTIGGTAEKQPKTGAGTLANQALGNAVYYLNDTFNAASLKLPFPAIPCLSGIKLEPAFTAPDPVNSGEPVGFDGMESDITLNARVSYPTTATTYPIFTWNFGDGSPAVSGYAPGQAALNSPNATPCQAPWLSPCAASTFHQYQYGGTYNVTLTAKDVGGNEASVTHEVTVSGPAPPSAPQTPGSGGSTQSAQTTTTSGSSTTTTPGTPTTPSGKHDAPAATQAVVSHSLSSVIKGGLVVRYSVDQQVAGRFEVLLASSIARKIGLHGSSATGLAKGTAPQTIIAKAILVTTKGGHSTYKIKFGKSTAARLRKLAKVSLMIRLVVHSAASPGVTTVLNTVNLSR